MRRVFIILMLLINLAFLNAKSDELFKDIKCKEAYLYHFLTRACCYGDEIGVRILLSQGAEPNGKGYKNYADCVGPFEYSSPLFLAVYNRHIEIVKTLLEAGANPNILEGEGVTPLVPAVKNEDIKIIKLLLKHGAKIDMKGLSYKPLKIAKEKQNDEIIKLLEDK